MRVVLATESSELRDRLRQVVLGVGLECAAADCVPFADLAVRLAQTGPGLVVIGAPTDPRSALSHIQHAANHCTAPIVAVGPAGDAQFLLDALRAGAREPIDAGRIQEDFLPALDRLRKAGSVQLRQGRTIAVLAVNPGAGVTTVASNLAFALAVKRPRHVVLAELGNGVPELALDLDLQPRHTLAELIRNWERLDGTMLRQAMVEHAAGVNILAYASEAMEPAPVPPPAMRQMLLLLRVLFDVTVLDLGHWLTLPAAEALRIAEAVVVVVRLDVPSLRLSRCFLRRLVDQGIPAEKLVVVANRYGQRKQIGWKKAEETLGLKVKVWLPDDPGAVNNALNQGKPLIQTASWSGLIRRINELARSVSVPVK